MLFRNLNKVTIVGMYSSTGGFLNITTRIKFLNSNLEELNKIKNRAPGLSLGCKFRVLGA